jgi:hypothetical protein
MPSPSNDNIKIAQINHPGTMMSPVMTKNLKSDCLNDSIRQKALEKMKAEVPLQYKPTPLETVDIGYGGVGSGHKEFTRDGEIAYQAALLLWATDIRQYGSIVLDILSDWSSRNKVFKGDNAPLEASWGICSMNRAAELIKHYPNAAIVSEWKKVEPSYFKWLDNIIMPVVRSQHVWKWPIVGNWHFSILCARLQTAILRNNVEEINLVTKAYLDSLPKAICCGNDWCIAETKRDVTHAQFLLGGVVQFAEMMYHQGIDLFDSRLIKVYENHARIMMKEIPSGITKDEIHTPYGYWYEPVWEIALAHFCGRRGKSMPYTEKWLNTFRPERVSFHWGGGTMTHYRRTK